MAKRNPSDSTGRRGSSKSNSPRKNFSSRSDSTDKQFGRKKSEPGPKKSDRPFSKTSGKSDNKFSRPYEKASPKRRENPSEDFDKRPTRRTSLKAADNPSEKKENGFKDASSTSRNNSFSRSPRKFDKPFGKPSSRKENNQDDRSPKKPFKRSPAKNKDDDSDEKKPKGFFNPTGNYSSSRTKFKTRKPSSEGPVHSDSDIIRLNKYISNSGVCSRREADEYIKMGLVSVNGNVITELGYKVKRSDEVRCEDKVLKAEKPVYILMNKPKGFITTTKDPEERKTVMHILGSAVKERVYPVGRLDRNTTGLLLLTNDGDLADKLMHPSYNAKKIYKVELDRPLTKGDFQKIRDGIRLEEGKAIVDDVAIISDDGKTIGVEIHIGWNRVVRRIFESLLYTVEKLDRSVYAGLDKKDLPRGNWRFLTKEEIVLLKHYK